MPLFSAFVFEKIKTSKNIPFTLALAQLRGAPGQAMVSLAAIVASFSLMAAMAIMVASFRSSVDDWLGAVLPAELYFRTTQAGETAWIDPALEARVRALPQVERVGVPAQRPHHARSGAAAGGADRARRGVDALSVGGQGLRAEGGRSARGLDLGSGCGSLRFCSRLSY